MDLIDRYVQRVRYFLPSPNQDDIIRELAADVRAELQDRQAKLGRPSADADVQAVLQRWGHPILVAGRYLPTQYLIGPALFPIYWFVLKVVGTFFLVPWLLIWIGLVVLSPSHRDALDAMTVLGSFTRWATTALVAIGWVTVVFAVLERLHVRVLGRWDPSELPAVHDHNAVSRFSTLLDAVGSGVFILFWTGYLTLPALPHRGGEFAVVATAAFGLFFWPVLMVEAVVFLLAIVNLYRPWWTWPRAVLHFLANLATVGLAALMLQRGPWVGITSPDLAASTRDALTGLANKGAFWLILGIGLVAFLVGCLEDARRLYRMARRP